MNGTEIEILRTLWFEFKEHSERMEERHRRILDDLDRIARRIERAASESIERITLKTDEQLGRIDAAAKRLENVADGIAAAPSSPPSSTPLDFSGAKDEIEAMVSRAVGSYFDDRAAEVEKRYGEALSANAELRKSYLMLTDEVRRMFDAQEQVVADFAEQMRRAAEDNANALKKAIETASE